MQLVLFLGHLNANRLIEKSNNSDSGLRGIQAVAQKNALTIKPLHPGIKDPVLSSQAYVELPATMSYQDAESIKDQFLGCENVEAAYLKAVEEAPQ